MLRNTQLSVKTHKIEICSATSKMVKNHLKVLQSHIMIMNFVCHTIFHFPIKFCLIFLVCGQKAQESSKCGEISRFQQKSEKLLFGLDIRFYSLILLKTCKHTPKDSFELNNQFYYLLSCKLQNVDIREFWAISANIAFVAHAKNMSQLFPRVRWKDGISLSLIHI